MKAAQFLSSLEHVPMVMNGNKPIKASNSERRRWLQNKAVVINGKTAGPDDEIEFPVTQLIFFPNSEKRRCTMV